MFRNAKSFNGDLSKWDVSSVTDTINIFRDATAFKGDISKWDVSSVTDMSHMFWNAKSFNGDISKWDASSVTNMYGMFTDATSFDGDLSKWDVSSVTNMYAMFRNAKSFNGDLSKWDVSSVTDMSYMFHRAKSFTRVLCGTAWFDSLADKTDMFVRSPGSLSKVCESVTAQTISTSIITPGPNKCSKCSTNKNGKSSCCARGGSWFQKCGNAGDDHTWAEGVEACKCTLEFGGT